MLNIQDFSWSRGAAGEDQAKKWNSHQKLQSNQSEETFKKE